MIETDTSTDSTYHTDVQTTKDLLPPAGTYKLRKLHTDM
jgi:hypothetical protein